MGILKLMAAGQFLASRSQMYLMAYDHPRRCCCYCKLSAAVPASPLGSKARIGPRWCAVRGQAGSPSEQDTH